jgi:hypothetical protein
MLIACVKRFWIVLLVVSLAVPCFGQLTLENPGFDAAELADGAWGGIPAGWQGDGAAEQDLTASSLNPPAQSGENVCAFNQGNVIYQDILESGSPHRVQANKTYKVSVWVGRRGGTEGTYGGILRVFLQDSATATTIDEAIYDMDNPDQPRNSWTFQTFYLSTGANPPGVNFSTLQIGFANISERAPANQFWFSQVILDDVSIESVNPIAINPSPGNNSLINTKSVTLQWEPGPFATEHDIYLSNNRDDVVNATSSSTMGPENVYKARRSASSIVIDGLSPSMTYYWRIDEVGGSSIYKGDIWQFTVRPPTAYDPVPVNGTPFTDINVQLSWSSGTGAISHQVYLGTNMEDVQAGTADTDKGIVEVSSFTPEPLEYERTYYWRIDEDDGTSIHAGDIWKFNTAPELPIIDPTLVGWWKLDEVEGIGALDSSGYGNHGTLFGGLTWIPGEKEGGLDIDGVDGSFVNCGNPSSLNVTAAITLSIWVNTVDAGTSQDDPFMTKGNSSYALRHTAANNIAFDVIDGQLYTAAFPVTEEFNGTWRHLAGTYDGSELNLYIDGELQATETHQGTIATNTFAVSIGSDNEQTWMWYNGAVDDARIYSRALTAEEVMDVILGDTSVAGNPKPGYGALVDLVQAFPLTWTPGENAVQHDVYLGVDKVAVAEADTSTAQIYQGRLDANSFTPPETPAWNQPHYWRIDEINTDSTVNKGKIWIFTILDYLLVDDFEAYNDLNVDEEGSNRIYMTWTDGYDNPSVNGSTIGYPDPDFANGEHLVETDIVHGGNQSAPLFFDDRTASYSEVTVSTDDLSIGRDWTIGNPETLSLWVYGDPNNAVTEQMYVKINNAKVTVNPDLTQAEWQEVTVDLAAFNTNFSNVTSFGIGFERTGATGGSGMVFIDDIRLNLL